ncbi:MAG: cell division protein ZapE [Pseudomonadota bacterium]|nr:cell division protein ZapE [Pseudomonadota bacterium]
MMPEEPIAERFSGHATPEAAAVGPLHWYRKKKLDSGFRPDAAQERAAARLQQLFDELIEFKSFRSRPFMKTFGRRPPPRGLYIHGGVGRGKSMLMDVFYSQLPYRRKRRVHFHAFMQTVHRELAGLKLKTDPLALVAEKFARDLRVLCFDEFHVSDIADAMILARLLENMFARGIVCVVTSNYRPDALYPNGLQRERFLPAIDFIKNNLDVIEIAGDIDHRLRSLEQLDLYHSPLGPAANEAMLRSFTTLAPGPPRTASIEVNGRKIHARSASSGIGWFEFAELCGTARSQSDYLELAKHFHTIMLANVPRMAAEHAAEARRFTWLIDVLYDQRVNLIISAAAPLEDLYRSGPQSQEFPRTISRLKEMQAREYLASQHVG